MLALIAGRGALPLAVVQAQTLRPLICALDGSLPDHVEPDHVFRLERLGGFLRWLREHGVTRICFCGAVDRPDLSWKALDVRTLTLLPKIHKALARGDDGALRIAISVFESAGFDVVAAHEAAPDLLPTAGLLTTSSPKTTIADLARFGDDVSRDQGAQDLGQACVIGPDGVIARETEDGTDAMLMGLGDDARGAIFFKASKPGQDRRADLPVVGYNTAQRIIEKHLAGMVIEAGGVMVLDQLKTIKTLNAAGAFLWVRERPV